MKAVGQHVSLSTSCVPHSARGLLELKLAPDPAHPVCCTTLPWRPASSLPLRPPLPGLMGSSPSGLLPPRCLSLAFKTLLGLASSLDSRVGLTMGPHMTLGSRASFPSLPSL